MGRVVRLLGQRAGVGQLRQRRISSIERVVRREIDPIDPVPLRGSRPIVRDGPIDADCRSGDGSDRSILNTDLQIGVRDVDRRRLPKIVRVAAERPFIERIGGIRHHDKTIAAVEREGWNRTGRRRVVTTAGADSRGDRCKSQERGASQRAVRREIDVVVPLG